MLNRRHCCHCGGNGPFVRVATCQGTRGDVIGHLCLCAACEAALSDAAFRERLVDYLSERMSARH